MRFLWLISALYREYSQNLYYFLVYRKSFYKEFPNEEKYKNGKNILFIPGFAGYNHQYNYIARFLDKKSYNVFYIPGYKPLTKISENALQVEKFLDNHNDRKFHVIAHSKGGLVMRYLLKYREKNLAKIEKVTTISTPYRGTLWGVLRIFNLYELIPGSKVIQDLDIPQNFDGIFHQYHASFDQTAIPNSSLKPVYIKTSELPVIGHGNILRSEVLVRSVNL